MKKPFLLIAAILIILSMNISGQGSCPKMYIEAKYKKQYFQEGNSLAQEYCLIGLPLKSLIEDDKGPRDRKLCANAGQLKCANAGSYIYQAIKRNDIVLLNESHCRPEQRALLYSLLDSLKAFGINSVFLETFSYTGDDSTYLSAHPIQSLGLYTRENVFSQVCNKLKKLQFKLYSYEISHGNPIDTLRIEKTLYFIDKADSRWLPIKADELMVSKLYSKSDMEQREVQQAIHIYQKLLRNNIKKAFIYCGWDHAFKDNGHLAGLLEHLLQKQVYSIDQTILTEHSEKKFEDTLYTKFATSNYPFVITDNKDNPIHSFYYPKYKVAVDSLIDLFVGIPRTTYINNRPTWLELNGDRKRYALSKFIDTAKIKTDFLVTIYDNNEYKEDVINTVPEDVFQVEHQSKDYDTILNPNKTYRLFVTQNNQILIDKIIKTNE